ncbi:MAG: hypothetical protein ACREJ2_14070, partial [Planctomycetota bacterium]
ARPCVSPRFSNPGSFDLCITRIFLGALLFSSRGFHIVLETTPQGHRPNDACSAGGAAEL